MSFTRTRLLAAVIAADSLLAIGFTVAGASAAVAPRPAPPASAPADMTFVPPKVGPIKVAIGPTIIGGTVIDPGLQLTLPAVSADGAQAADAAAVATNDHMGASSSGG